MKKIDFEAHFYTREYLKALAENEEYPRLIEGNEEQSRRLWYAPEVGQPFEDFLLNAVLDVGEKRLEKMDACGKGDSILARLLFGLPQGDFFPQFWLCSPQFQLSLHPFPPAPP